MWSRYGLSSAAALMLIGAQVCVDMNQFDLVGECITKAEGTPDFNQNVRCELVLICCC